MRHAEPFATGTAELAKVTNAYEQEMYEESHGALTEPRLVSADAALGSVRHSAWVRVHQYLLKYNT